MKSFTFKGGMNEATRVPEEIIGDHAFYLWRGLEEVHLSEGLKVIGANAFGICSSLPKIRIPSTVETIGKLAFGDCINLEEINFAAESKLKQIDKLVFSGCTWLSDINLPQTIKEIGTESFKECRNLKSIDLSHQLKIIRHNAFENCVRLEKVKLHEGLKIVESYSFYTCFSLLRIAIPSTAKTIEDEAFNSCSHLEEVVLKPGRLKCLAYGAFGYCSKLESISIPSTIEKIQKGAFAHCNLRSVELHPDADIEIEAHAFGDNKQLCNISSQNSPSARINKNALRSTSEYSWDSEEAYLKLKFWESRYFGYPVHRPKLCYHASTTTVVELRKAAIECKATVKPDLGYSSFGSDPDDGSDASDVSFGDPALDASFNLTPFHVLLSAAKRRTDLLEVLLDKFPLHACSDNGKTCGVIGLWNSWLETGMETPGKWQR